MLNFLSHHRERRATKAALHRERRILSHPICSHHRERRATKATLHRERRYTPPRNPLSSPREKSHQGSSSSGEERTSATGGVIECRRSALQCNCLRWLPASEALYVADPVSQYLVRSPRRISPRPAYASQQGSDTRVTPCLPFLLGSGTRVTPCRPFLLSFPGFEAPCLKPSMNRSASVAPCRPMPHDIGGSLPPDAQSSRSP